MSTIYYKSILLLLICVVPVVVYGADTIVINEFMAVNVSVTNDPQGQYDDWIEIYNYGGSPVDIGGMYITDDLLDRTQFRIPTNDSAATTISPGGFLLLWADNDTLDGTLHLGFRLSGNGDQIGLYNTDGSTLIDSITFGVQLADISYGRYPDGSNDWRSMSAPTPSSPNNAGQAKAVAISPAGGTFTTDVTITLTATNSTQIYYTTDGSIPTTNSFAYSSPITTNTTVRIRAVAFETGFPLSPVVSTTYVKLNADLWSFTSDLPIVIVDNFGAGAVPLPANPRQSAYMAIFEQAAGRNAMTNAPTLVTRIGIKRRGRSSLSYPKQSFSVEAWRETDVGKNISPLGMPAESDWVLHGPASDKTLMRNHLTYRWWEEVGRYSIRTRFVEVFLNTDNATLSYANDYLGVYVFMENIKGSGNRVGSGEPEASTNLADITGGYIIEMGGADAGDFTTTTSGQTVAYAYEDPNLWEMNSTQRTWIQNYIDDFESALYGTNFTDPDLGYARYTDVGAQVDYEIFREFTRNFDGGSSYFHVDRGGGKLTMGPLWDYNMALGNVDYAEGGDEPGYFTNGWNDSYMAAAVNGWSPWWYRFEADPDYKQKFIDRWNELRKDKLATQKLLNDIEAVTNLLAETQARNFVRWTFLGTYIWANPPGWNVRTTYEDEVVWMKVWLRDRCAWIDSQFVAAPAFNQDGGMIAPGFGLTMSAPAGAIYYTTNGVDPRASGGGVASSAQTYGGVINLWDNTLARARAYDGVATWKWSAPAEAVFVVTPPELAITEIMYHPRPPQPGTPETNYVTADFEFIELQNIGAQTHSLLGVKLIDGVLFDFTYGALTNLPAGDYVIAVNNLAAFTNRYTNWAGMNIAGEYEGNLNDAGENVILTNWGVKSVILSFDYEDDWYPNTDGEGYSLTILDPAGNTNNWDTKLGWRHSAYKDGSPGADDSGSVLYAPGTIVINEALTHQDTEPPGDWIELYNTTAGSIDISDWYLSDSKVNPTKFQIPGGTILPANGYVVFTESAHFGTNILGLNGFALSEHGEGIYLSAGSGGALAEPAYREFDDFGVAERDVTFGRYIKTDGNFDFTAMETATSNAPNSNPLIGPVVIAEIMYNPTNGQHEFLELVNISGLDVGLYDSLNPANAWKVAGISFTFPTNITISNEVVLLVRDTISPAAFRTSNGVPAGVQIFNYSGALDNDKDTITLRKPGAPDEIGVPYIDVDMVKYNDSAPWPVAADGYGYSLDRINAAGYGNDVINWTTNVFGGTPGVPTVVPTNPVIFVSGTINVSTPEDVNASNRIFDVRNMGIDTLVYTISETNSWLDVTVTNGTSTGSGDVQFHFITFSTASLTVGTYNAEITISSTNAANSPVVLNLDLEVTVREKVPPGIDTVTSTNSIKIKVVFNEPVEAGAGPNGAELVSNYSVDNGVTLSSAVLGGDNMTVILTTISVMTEGTNYELTVDNVADRAPIPNPIVTTLTNIFQYVFNNAAPVANAGTNQTVYIQAMVTLDGSGSSDPDIKPFPLTYAWIRISGPVVTINNANSAVASFNATEAGDYIFQLRVFDGVDTSTDNVNVTVVFANTIPYAESFESYFNGFQLAGTNSWFASSPSAAVVVTNDYTNTYTGILPISGQHELVLKVSGSVTNRFTNTETYTNVWLDMMLEPRHYIEVLPPDVVTNAQFGVYVNSNGHLCVWNNSGSSNVWTELLETDIGSNEWIRLTVEADYSGNTNRFRIYTNGVPVTNTSAWFAMANTNGTYLSEIVTDGTGYFYLDDMVVTDYNVFSDLVLWLRQYYPATNNYGMAAVSDTDDDGMSAEGEYIAGTDPTDGASVFKILDLGYAGLSNYVTWYGTTNSGVDTPFAIYRKTNLLDALPWSFVTNFDRNPTGTNKWWDGSPPSNALSVYYRIAATNVVE